MCSDLPEQIYLCEFSFFPERSLSEGCLLSSTIIPEQLPSSLHSINREYLPKPWLQSSLDLYEQCFFPVQALPFFTQLSNRAKPVVPLFVSSAHMHSAPTLSPAEAELDRWFCSWPVGSGRWIAVSPHSQGAPEASQPLTCLLGWHPPWASGSNRLDSSHSGREGGTACRSSQQTS